MIYNNAQVIIDRSEFFNNALVDDGLLPQFNRGAAILNRGQASIFRSTFRRNGVIPGGEGQFLPDEHVIHNEVGCSPLWGGT